MIQILTANIICDNCQTQIFISTDADWVKYRATWFEGILDEYCPTCSQLSDVKAQIEEELRITTNFRNEPEGIYEFPEYIS